LDCSGTHVMQYYFQRHFLCDYDDVRAHRGTAVAQWLRCCAINRKVTGSIPAVTGILH